MCCHQWVSWHLSSLLWGFNSLSVCQKLHISSHAPPTSSPSRQRAPVPKETVCGKCMLSSSLVRRTWKSVLKGWRWVGSLISLRCAVKEESRCSLSRGLGGLNKTRNISWLTELEVNKLPLSSLFITKVYTTRASRIVHIQNSAFLSRSLLTDPVPWLSWLFLCLSKIQDIHVISWNHWTIFRGYNILLFGLCSCYSHLKNHLW